MRKMWKTYAAAACWIAGLVIFTVDRTDAASPVTRWDVTPTALVSHDQPPMQRVNLSIACAEPLQPCSLRVWAGDQLIAEKPIGKLEKGDNHVSVLLPEPGQKLSTRWELTRADTKLAEQTLAWVPPRHWTLYVIKSSHVDIGLHDPQYKQRRMAVDYIDQARQLADKTADWPDASRYRYIIEGMWWWSNYPKDRSEQAARDIVGRYVQKGLFDIGASHSGNHTQVYGLEELCRSAYTLRDLRQRWKTPADTMIMADNNGITWPLVTAYADAGLKNLIFLPNAWNPKTIGSSRIDVGWDSKLPHIFYWQGADAKSRILVWANPHYHGSARAFGLNTTREKPPFDVNLEAIAPQMARQLALLESRYPYDVWLVSNYKDNETPNLNFPETAKAWNARWRWPQLRTVGDLSEPFEKVEARFGDQIPTLRGDITGGWAQHPVSTPPLLAKKREADRLLPIAEILATLARLSDPKFIYPTLELNRAWDALIANDEHGYGVSYYKGRPVYDTWMQKRDWIARGLTTARTQSDRALKTLAALAPTDGPSVFVFNPTLQARAEIVEVELPESCAGLGVVHAPDGTAVPAAMHDGVLSFKTSPVPSMGYAVYRLAKGDTAKVQTRPSEQPPAIENIFYRVTFDAAGSIVGIYDKQLDRQLIDDAAPYRSNQFVYTRDTYKTFTSPNGARFEVETSPLGQTAIARMDDPLTGAAIEQRVTLPTHEKRIDIDNRLNHVRDLANDDRWKRFGYYAFPFDVPDGTFEVGLNGCTARPTVDQTGHGTDAYLAARDWADISNDDFGITLVQKDSCLVECGKIHADKKAFGELPATSHLFSYVLNDWLYAHAYVTGPSHINLRFRYVIRSHSGGAAKSKAATFAEHAVTPSLATVIPHAQRGSLPARQHSFMSVDAPNVSLLTLKLSQTPGRGVIARFHETAGRPADVARVKLSWGSELQLTQCSLTEIDRAPLTRPELQTNPFAYATLRIESKNPPPPAPKLTAGDCTDKSISLQWEPVAGVQQYRIYRGEQADFAPDEYHLLTTTDQTHHVDDWLSPGAIWHYRIAAVTTDLRQSPASSSVQAKTLAKGDSPPARVGNVYTGLISDPRAWRGDTSDMLYLQWGQNLESDLSRYELYRAESSDFELTADTFVADVLPGPYVTARFEDTGLKPHTTYYYRVRAVDRDGHKGSPSALCSGTTREPN